jgi:hypothetical protein
MPLDQDIRFELVQLERLAKVSQDLIAVPPEARRPWDSAAAAKYIADFYAGFENLCKQRMGALGIPFPEGSDSHSRILNDFLAQEDLGGRLTPGQSLLLKKYLRFRHRFIHGYGFDVSWEMVAEPLAKIPETVALLKRIWTDWLRTRTGG